MLFVVLISAAASAGAQSFQQGFFLEGYKMAYRYNPAIQNEDGFLSVGQFESRLRNNVGASSFLYNRNGEVVTAFNSGVSATEFLGSLKDDNFFTGDINYNLVSYGWRSGAAYHTLEANVRGHAGASVPKEIFEIIKKGTGEASYDLGGMRIFGNIYAELAYGYSHKLSDMVSIGARAKLLLGLYSVDYNVTRFDMELNEDEYRANIEADLDLTSRYRKMKTDENGYYKLKGLSSKDKWKLPSAAGLAIDLGVLVKPVEGLELSASILDLGGMLWYYGNAGKSQGTVSFAGVTDLTIEQIKAKDFGDEFQEVKDEFIKTMTLRPADKKVNLSAVPFTVNLGAKYAMPFYSPLSAGFTGTFICQNGMAYNEGRAAVAWNPSGNLGVTANVGAGTYGMVYGFGLNAAYRNFRLTVGYGNGTGGRIPYKKTPLKPNFKAVTLGLTYDL